MALHQLVDLDRYPIDAPESAAFSALVDQCRDQMKALGCCVLDGFLAPGVATQMAEYTAEAAMHHRQHLTSAWGDPPLDELPSDHVHRRRFPEDIYAVAGDQFGADHPLRRLYQSDTLTDFLAAALNLDELHRFADPYQDLNVVKILDGGLHAWHYDLSDFVVTILLQKPEVGGQFEFAPFIRGEVIPGVVGGRDGRVWDERYDDVEQLLAGAWSDTHVVDLEPGTLMLFNGVRSMHRVRAVHGPTPRMVSVLSYDRQPNFCSTTAINTKLYGCRVAR